MCFTVDLMFLDESVTIIKGKKYYKCALCESYREGKKVNRRTIANLRHCSKEEIDAIRLALKHKKELEKFINNEPSQNISLKGIEIHQELSVGAVYTLHEIAKRLNIVEALGSSRDGKLALWQIYARIIDQGSRLSAVRLAGSHAACDILEMDAFNEEDLYENLGWLHKNQASIEDRLILNRYHDGKKPDLFLYDVTSSYFEGEHNELAAFGYNRDKKKGKRQIVIGLLCDKVGRPVSIEVFPGNTNDTKTVTNQLEKISKRFGGIDITLVGDRGMLKSKQQEDILSHKYHFITAITKPQIDSLLKSGIIQMNLFDHELTEVISDEDRYILKRNPIRAQEISTSKESKYNAVFKAVVRQNKYLKEHIKAKPDTALKKIQEQAKRLKILSWVDIKLDLEAREIKIDKNIDALKEDSKLDGCYVIITDLKVEVASKEIIHDRYKDLAQVERAFRVSKTVDLEIRPIYLRKEERTRAHALVVMLSYLIVQELSDLWKGIDLTVSEGINELGTLCSQELSFSNKATIHKIPSPRENIRELLDAAKVHIPEVIVSRGIRVVPKKNLMTRRKSA